MSDEQTVEYVFDIPGSLWLTANHRPTHWVRSRKTRGLKSLAYNVGIGWPRKKFTKRVRLEVTIHPRTNTNFDPENVQPTEKALLDGLVQAGVLIDDNWRYVEGPEFKRGQPVRTLQRGQHRVVMKLIPIGEVIRKEED